jgi:hypothetical protein
MHSSVFWSCDQEEDKSSSDMATMDIQKVVAAEKIRSVFPWMLRHSSIFDFTTKTPEIDI